MRIVLVTETFPPEVNGVARTLLELVRGLSKEGHEVLVVRPRQGAEAEGAERPFEEWLAGGIPIPSYPGLRFGLPAKRRLIRLFEQWRPDVVHIATEGPLGLSALRAAATSNLPVTSSFHTNFHQYGRFYGYAGLVRPLVAYLRWFHNRTRRTLVPTGDVRAALAIEGFERLDIIARGVDAELFDPARRDEELRRSWGAGPDDPVVLYVGRLAKEKHPDLARAAFGELRRLWPGCRTVVVGDGPAAAEMQKKDPETLFCGMQRGEELARHYASADLLLFPSLTETFGNVLLEGMASGLPVVAFDYAAAGTLMSHGVDGFVAPFGQEERWLDQVRALPAMSLERLRRVGRRARQRALEQTWQSIVARFRAVLEEVVAEAPATPKRVPALPRAQRDPA